ncbi:hypothetical protein I7I50_08105 [Histoplasma capsulatum G186AR]|uniref:Uncharacterized protein n=1 Tax=Ajellomyces capsulatus TaxID=5037 RepID=A0A8H7YK73_AJECA|nr:hypothetical protein I7I52_08621 [Histoplasma capsulatum]QSS68630.1 hypothetical protein I7I50_08105 [Histoplasma capsulatum G186AR]
MDLFYLRSTPCGHHARANTVNFLYLGDFFFLFLFSFLGLTSTKYQDVMVRGGKKTLLSGGYHFGL